MGRFRREMVDIVLRINKLYIRQAKFKSTILLPELTNIYQVYLPKNP
jgi:hypothetical protein